MKLKACEAVRTAQMRIYTMLFQQLFSFLTHNSYTRNRKKKRKKGKLLFPHLTSCTISWRLITQRIHVARFWKAFHISYNYSFASHILNIHNIHDCFLCLCFNSQLAFRRSCTSALCLLSCKEFISHSIPFESFFFFRTKSHWHIFYGNRMEWSVRTIKQVEGK